MQTSGHRKTHRLGVQVRRALPVASGRVRTRVTAYAGVLLVIAAMLWPVLREPPRDSYPLSPYPMFSTTRERLSTVATVVGLTAQGDRVRLGPRLVGGTDEVMLAVRTASLAVAAGEDRVISLCEQVAERVIDAGRTDIVTVEVVTETYDAVDHLAHGAPAYSVSVHATCEVPG